MNDELVYVHHILDAIGNIQSLVKTMTYKKFLRSWVARSATIQQLAVIGEAANHFSDEFQLAHPNIPCRQIIGMRNKLVHDHGRRCQRSLACDPGRLARTEKTDEADSARCSKQIEIDEIRREYHQ